MDEETRQELLDIENAIARLHQNANDISKKTERLTEEMEYIKAKTLLEVTEARDSLDRIKYPSQEVRKAAVTVQLREHNEYQAILKEYRPLREEWETIYAEISRLQKRKDILMIGRGRFLGLF